MSVIISYLVLFIAFYKKSYTPGAAKKGAQKGDNGAKTAKTE
jgi:hypothetical protein